MLEEVTPALLELVETNKQTNKKSNVNISSCTNQHLHLF